MNKELMNVYLENVKVACENILKNLDKIDNESLSYYPSNDNNISVNGSLSIDDSNSLLDNKEITFSFDITDRN